MTLSQLRFGNPTGVARGWRAVASWLCVAGFRRLCLCRAPSGRGRRPAELLCVDSYANETAANISTTSRVAGGPAVLATCVAVVPQLCVTVVRRLCSEQRACHVTTTGQCP